MSKQRRETRNEWKEKEKEKERTTAVSAMSPMSPMVTSPMKQPASRLQVIQVVQVARTEEPVFTSGTEKEVSLSLSPSFSLTHLTSTYHHSIKYTPKLMKHSLNSHRERERQRESE